MYNPELKIKYFLDSLAYFLLLGHTEGIETAYKRVIHAKREIPVSSCPGEIGNLLYATGASADMYNVEERAAFNEMLDTLDAKAAPYEIKRAALKRTPSKFIKKLKSGIRGGTWYRVDTDGRFTVDGDCFVIGDQEVQYQPVATEYGDYYAMDRILYSGGRFYDMNYDEVVVYKV